jgi:hypothetical protein
LPVKGGRYRPERNQGADSVREADPPGDHLLDLGVESTSFAVGFYRRSRVCPRPQSLIDLSIGLHNIPDRDGFDAIRQGEAVVPLVAQCGAALEFSPRGFCGR